MNYIIHPWIFYLFDLIDKLGILLIVFLVVGGFLTGVSLICLGMDGNFQDPLFIFARKMVIPLIISAFLLVLIPSKDTLTKMLVASYVTTENVDKAATTSKDIVDYITEKIVEMKEAEGTK